MDHDYNDMQEILNKKKVRELLRELPGFCKNYFRSIDQRTSSRTQLGYAYDLRTFFQTLKELNPCFRDKPASSIGIDDIKQLEAADFEEYMERLRYGDLDRISAAGIKSGDSGIVNDREAVARKMSALRGLFKYLLMNDMIEQNPLDKVSMPKLLKKSIIYMEADEVATILDDVEYGSRLTDHQQKYHDKAGTRDLAILTLLLGTGIRVSELVGLNINDIDFKNARIAILRKGGKEAFVYFGDEVEEALLSYMEERNSTIPAPGHEHAFFLSMQKKRLCVRSVEKLVKKYASGSVPGKKITPHKLRSTFGTNLYRETGDIYLVADSLGHESVTTTARHYADIGDERRRQSRKITRLREKNNE